jgi:hypothetical protein
MTPFEQLCTTLAALRLTAIDARLEGLLENAAKKELSYGDFLFEVMNTEAGGTAPALPERAGCSWRIFRT